MRKTSRGENALGDRMRLAAQQAGLTQAEIARRMGVGKTTVSVWWNGKQPPTSQNLRRYAEVVGTTVGWLEGEDQNEGERAARWLLQAMRRTIEGKNPETEFDIRYGRMDQETRSLLFDLVPEFRKRWASLDVSAARRLEMLIDLVEEVTGIRLAPPDNGGHA